MSTQYILELIGTYFFAISGALAVSNVENDLFGASFTGFITAIGGGTLRDLILDSHPLVWIADSMVMYAIFAGILTAIIFYKYVIKLRKTLLLFDTMGIALFTVLGVEKALQFGVGHEVAVIMGIFSAVMGGVIRDTLSNITPVIFKKEIYASACMVGAIMYLLLNQFHVERQVNLLASASVIAAIRLLAIRFNLYLPSLGSWK
ncbi:trimeric intracellular cation channel family protein [Phaeocystidibacter marisrubri]|uniref:Trimeric intracellular cation channel family protein n=1 Tax=Phaeocystidibacter marisrubri TaxID=1577780 RepID=A0A6L3ZJ26_9FLAO|nr:trimeric intracellular cation channel family protein [Phaeocystidibacter marisrubri]KAB2817817.1 trimeric intracellular cation channel family protein [Phaeocystidibacter marisrubri]GGH73369.1 membrane protein [Phaeocystidibacter marisrubri]